MSFSLIGCNLNNGADYYFYFEDNKLCLSVDEIMPFSKLNLITNIPSNAHMLITSENPEIVKIEDKSLVALSKGNTVVDFNVTYDEETINRSLFVEIISTQTSQSASQTLTYSFEIFSGEDGSTIISFTFQRDNKPFQGFEYCFEGCESVDGVSVSFSCGHLQVATQDFFDFCLRVYDKDNSSNFILIDCNNFAESS